MPGYSKRQNGHCSGRIAISSDSSPVGLQVDSRELGTNGEHLILYEVGGESD